MCNGKLPSSSDHSEKHCLLLVIREGVRSHYPNLAVPGSNQFKPEPNQNWTEPAVQFAVYLKDPLNQTELNLAITTCDGLPICKVDITTVFFCPPSRMD